MHEVKEQCSAAIHAFSLMNQMRGAHPRDRFLLSVAHQLIVHGGNVAKLLFPAAGKNTTPTMEKRAAAMRSALQVDRKHLQPLRNARNYLEHFDNRMEKCIISRPDAAIFSQVVYSDESEILAIEDGEHLFLKCLISSTWELILLDETYRLTEFVGLLEELHLAAEREVENIEQRMSGEQRRLESMFDMRAGPA